jgi:hypothetical protein
MIRFFGRGVLGALVAMVLAMSGAFAQITELTVNTSNSTNGLFFNTHYDLDASADLSPSGLSKRTYYSIVFNPTASRSYTFGMTSAHLDAVMMIYSGQFDPNAPLTNLLAFGGGVSQATHRTTLADPSRTVDCNGSSGCPQLSQSLTSGSRYTLVMMSYSCCSPTIDDIGPTISVYVDGPGAFASQSNSGDSSTPVPERVNRVATALSLLGSSAAVRNQIDLRQNVLTTMLGYDSNTFGAQGISVSFIGRYSGLGDSLGEGAGALVASYRLLPTLRIGAFIDYAVAREGNDGIRQGDAEPSFGGFAVYQSAPDLTGLNARVAGAYTHGRIEVTRTSAIPLAEPGSGKASLSGYAFGAEAGYGFGLAAYGLKDMVAVPYVGLRYADVTRGAYAEGATDAVTKPLTYDDYSQRLTTATAGVRLHGKLFGDFSYVVGLGAEYDLDRHMGNYSGTSSIAGMAEFGLTTHANANRLRAAGSVGVDYKIAANQNFSAEFAVRQQAYTRDPAYSTLLKYSVGF